jgi:hypothetical protein
MKTTIAALLLLSAPLLACDDSCQSLKTCASCNCDSNSRSAESCCGDAITGQETKSSDSELNEEAPSFEVPSDWTVTDPNEVDSRIVMLATGKGKLTIPPTLNLATEKTEVTLRQYLKIIRENTMAEGREWKEIGNIETVSGTANLSQCDIETKWGKTRLLHAILLRDQVAYVLTASAMDDEFADNYELFFNSLRSLQLPKGKG